MAISLDSIKRLATQGSADIEALAEARAAIPAKSEEMSARYEDLLKRRDDVLISGDKKEIDSIEREITECMREIETLGVCEKRLADLERRARENQHREEVDRLRQKALEAAASAEELYKKTYLQAGACILAVIKSFAEADAARERYSRASGDNSLSTPETVVRNRPATACKVVHTEIVELFVLEGETQPASEIVQEHIRATGMAPPASPTEIRSRSPVYVRRKFRKNVIAQPVSAIFADPLAQEVVLPPLRAGERHLWNGESDGRHRSTTVAAVDAALEQIARLETGESNIRPAPETIEYELLPDADPAATARAIEETRHAAR